jgi:hypothetical protein
MSLVGTIKPLTIRKTISMVVGDSKSSDKINRAVKGFIRCNSNLKITSKRSRKTTNIPKLLKLYLYTLILMK